MSKSKKLPHKDTPQGFSSQHTFTIPYGGQITRIAWAPDGRMIASASAEATIRMWEVETGCGLSVMEGHGHGIASVSFSPHGLFLASKSFDNTIRLRRADT